MFDFVSSFLQIANLYDYNDRKIKPLIDIYYIKKSGELATAAKEALKNIALLKSEE
jgi:hypothetical protein